MRRRFLLPALAGLALILATSVDSAEAARRCRQRTRTSVTAVTVQKPVVNTNSTKLRKTTGTAHWNLGNHYGEWPPYH